MSPITLVLISAGADFLIAGGGVVLGGNIQASGQVPSPGVWIMAGVAGVVAFGKEVKQRLEGAQAEHAAQQPKP